MKKSQQSKKVFKENLGKVDKNLFEKINALLKENGIDDAEVTSLKIKNTNPQALTCPPGKVLYCWTDINGRKYCKCV
ncbi:hypothetical protein [Urechidicola croceus]|uniref:Uncharacterized protein n=1 Tax=Urechidicola croceus TaxID=1850246 RepID=A0A1D8P846_9FLAO|nr:hypothetical protein [Urechidicola croceus]AOW20746.1 hypothetical protein LPB138_08685 [Urechidicola croceus]